MSNDLLKTCEALFCDPEGNPCLLGSDGDRAELACAMKAHQAATLAADEKYRALVEALTASNALFDKLARDMYDASELFVVMETNRQALARLEPIVKLMEKK